MRIFLVAGPSDVKMQGTLRGVGAAQLISYYLFCRAGAKTPRELMEMTDADISGYVVRGHPRPASNAGRHKKALD